MGLSPLLKQAFFNDLAADNDFNLRIYYQISDLATGLGVTLLIATVVGVIPAYIATKLEIVEALRNLPPSKVTSKLRKIITPLTGIVVFGLSYWFLKQYERNLIYSLVGLIPFILALLVIATLVIPLFTKGISYGVQWLLGSYRQLTERNMGDGQNRKQTNISFMMFATAIAFLVMVSNTLISIQRIQISAIPRYIGNDLVIYSEGSTFGMDELLVNDEEFIKGAVNNATLFSMIRTKINGYGVYANEGQREPQLNTYIIEPRKFVNVNHQITLHEPKQSTDAVAEVFGRLEDEAFKIVLCRQLADEDHLNVAVGDEVEVNFSGLKYKFEVIGIVDFVAGFSETWQESHEILPADKNGRYASWISWQTATIVIDGLYEGYPDLHIAIKADDHDSDFWDFPLFNATEIRELLQPYENQGLLKMAERVWDNETNSAIVDSSYSWADLLLLDPEEIAAISKNVHIVFQNTSINGMTTFVEKRLESFKTVQDALNSGVDQCVITSDIEIGRAHV